MKTDNIIENMEIKSWQSDLIFNKEFDDNERTIIHYITTETPDRYGDIVIARGMDDKNYSKNPVVFFNHDPYKPVGKSLWRKPDDGFVISKTQFSKTDFANDIYTLHKEGVLNAWSIGFRPKKDKIERLPEGGFKFNEWELIEYSSVGIPAQPEAVDIAKSIVKSYIMKDQIFAIEQSLFIDKKIKEIENELKELAELKTDIEKYKEISKFVNEFIENKKVMLEALRELDERLKLIELFIESETNKAFKSQPEIVVNPMNLQKQIQEAIDGAIRRIMGKNAK